MNVVSREADGGHLCVRDCGAIGITASIDLRSHAETWTGCASLQSGDDGGETDERGTAPIRGDVREEAMFDLVPLARPQGEVTHVMAGPVRFANCCSSQRLRPRIGAAPIYRHHSRIALTARRAVSWSPSLLI